MFTLSSLSWQTSVQLCKVWTVEVLPVLELDIENYGVVFGARKYEIKFITGFHKERGKLTL